LAGDIPVLPCTLAKKTTTKVPHEVQNNIFMVLPDWENSGCINQKRPNKNGRGRRIWKPYQMLVAVGSSNSVITKEQTFSGQITETLSRIIKHPFW
jgi:hypothetical protein